MAPLLDHLWQSSLVALLAAALTLTVRRNGARVRFWLWFAASVKFLLPFAGLAALGAWLSRLYPQALTAPLVIRPAIRFSAPAHLLPPGDDGVNLTPWLLGLWALGLAAVLGLRLTRWLRLRALLADARELRAAPLRVKTSASLMEPGLVGILDPVVVLPAGLLQHLAPSEIDAILAHERSHLARRDNLTAAIHMLVEALFWFYPPVWLIGARLIAERERACDESVVASGHDPLTYAQAILKVCRFCIQSPLACVSGASGSNLNRRMAHIMAARTARDLDGAHVLLLGAAAIITLSLPILGGFATGPLATEVGRRAAVMQAQIQQVVAAPFRQAAPAHAHLRRPRHTVIAPAAPPAPAPVQSEAPAPQPVTPIIVTPVRLAVPAPTIAKQTELAITPTGEGDPDAVTCRVPQVLPGSRLPGPQVCRANRVWAALRTRGEEIMPDGQTVIISDAMQRRRILAAQDCTAIPGGSAIVNMLALPNSVCL